MSDWRDYRSGEARREVEESRSRHTPPVVRCGRLMAYRMKNRGEYAIHVEPSGLTKDERRFVKGMNKFRAFGFHGGSAFASSAKRGLFRPELFFVLDGTDMGYKAAYEDMRTGRIREVEYAWRNIQIADLTGSKFFALGELYDYLCR